MACTCPTVWNGILPPPCDDHNPSGRIRYSPPPAPSITFWTTCDTCGAYVHDAEVHAAWHENQAHVARNADLGAMSMRAIGGPSQ